MFLRPTKWIDSCHPEVIGLAAEVAGGDPIEVARRAFGYVRDRVAHAGDIGSDTLALAASDVLREGAAMCYGKAHLLAALLRANDLEAGICYQRLSVDEKGPPFCLHGLVAVNLPGVGWYRCDPRGNKAGVDAGFTPPVEQLAWPVRLEGEADLPGIWSDCLPIIAQCYSARRGGVDLAENLPDISVDQWPPADAPEGIGF